MRVGYARVSIKEQNLDSQVDALKEAGCEEVFTEVASGAKTARPVLDDMLSRLRAEDVLVIWKLDRLGRSLKHLVTLTTDLMEREIGLISIKDPIRIPCIFAQKYTLSLMRLKITAFYTQLRSL